MMARALCIAVILVPLAAHAQAPTPTLKHDPFVRPSLGGFRADGAPAARARPPLPPEDPKRILNLNAVMVAGPASMANVNGVMVRVGESLHGYRLLEVHDRSAVFEKNNMRITVDMPGLKK